MSGKPLPGIVIEIDPKPYSPTLAQITFRLKIGTREPGKLFVTSPRIRNAILAYQFVTHKPYIGHIVTIIRKAEREISLASVFPKTVSEMLIGERMKNEAPEWEANLQTIRENNPLWKSGIATLAEAAIKRYLKKQYPRYRSIQPNDQSLLRKAQLIKRGITLGKTISIERDYELTRRQAINNHRRAIGKRPLSKLWRAPRKNRR